MNDLNEQNKFTVNGYFAYYMPEHHLANGTGFVYEHMIVAEKILGRELNEGEVVHHKDENRKNNSVDNLMVFKTKSDHTAYHCGCDVALDGDIYIAIKKGKKSETGKHWIVNTCPFCGGEKSYTAIMCNDCRNKYNARNIPEKDKLKQLIYKYNMCEIGRMFGVSDNAVRKWCKKYKLPYKAKDIKLLRQNINAPIA